MVDSLVKNIPIKMETNDDLEAVNKQLHCLRYPKRRKHKNAETSYSSGVDNRSNSLISDVEQGKTEELFHNEIKVEPKLEATEEVFVITELEEDPTHNAKNQSHSEEDSKIYQCDKCSKNFRRQIDLREHKRSHRGEKCFKCEICDRAFTSKSYVWPHMQKKHKAAITAQMKEQWESYGESAVPMSSNTKLVASSASKQKSTIQRHPFGTTNFQCTVCLKTFSRNAALKIHTRIHTGEKPYTCDICQKSFRANANLNFHKKAHMGEKYKKYTCDHCDKRFIRKIDLRVHIYTHTGEKRFKCKICNCGYSSKMNLKSHMQRDHDMNLNGEKLPCRSYKEPQYDDITIKVLTKNKKRLRSAQRHKLKRKINCNDEFILPTNHEHINASYNDEDRKEQKCLLENSTIKLVSLAESADINTALIKEEQLDTFDEPMNSVLLPAMNIVKEEIMIKSCYMPED